MALSVSQSERLPIISPTRGLLGEPEGDVLGAMR